MDSTFVTRLVIKNYKSIRACDVQLGPLTVLVGLNGAGKSNFLDALRFSAEALSTGLDQALRDRGGINEVRRRSGGQSDSFAIRIDFRLRQGQSGHYAFEVAALPSGGFRVAGEECRILVNPEAKPSWYRVRNGVVQSESFANLPAATEDQLFLVRASSVPIFRQVFVSLIAMGFYNLSLSIMRQPQQPDPARPLRGDGSNLASVLTQIQQHNPIVFQRILDYLRRLSPAVESVAGEVVGPVEFVVFRQGLGSGAEEPSGRFYAANVSDGTLRGLGVLVAMLQGNGAPPTLVGIEEPEVALHPAAVGILIDAARDASQRTQVVLTSHSPELLDRPDIGEDEILAVSAEHGVTAIGRVEEATRQTLRESLFTAGELLRLNHLEPSVDDRSTASSDGVKVFGTR